MWPKWGFFIVLKEKGKTLSKKTIREEQTRPFLNHAFPEWHPPFSSFSSFSGVWGAKPLFSVGRMRIRHFRRFRQNGPFLAGDKNTVYQKHGLCDPETSLFPPEQKGHPPKTKKNQRGIKTETGTVRTSFSVTENRIETLPFYGVSRWSPFLEIASTCATTPASTPIFASTPCDASTPAGTSPGIPHFGVLPGSQKDLPGSQL